MIRWFIGSCAPVTGEFFLVNTGIVKHTMRLVFTNIHDVLTNELTHYSGMDN